MPQDPQKPINLKRAGDELIEKGLGWLTTPLLGETYEDEELFKDPSLIMSPKRVLGMATAPLDLIGNFIPGDEVLSMLPFFKGSKLARSLAKRFKGKTPTAVKTADDVSGLKTPTAPQPMRKAELPAEFQASGAEQEAYNELRRQREALKQPPITVQEPTRGSEGGAVSDPIRKAREKVRSNPKDVRGTALKAGPESFDEYLKQDLDNLRENIRPSHTAPTRRYGDDVFGDPWDSDNQQTFAGLDEFGEPTSQEGFDFMRDFNDMQHLDSERLLSLEELFERHNRDVVSKRQGYNLTGARNPYQRELQFGPGAPLFSADASIPPYKANEVIGIFNRAFDNVKSQHPRFPDLQPSDLVRKVDINTGSGGQQNWLSNKIDVGIDGAKHTTAHELQHASDQFGNPRIFDDYPEVPENAYRPDMPADYWTHPSEVRARAAGNVSNLIESGREVGQQTLPIDFLNEFALGLENIEGNNLAANKTLRNTIKTNNAKRAKAGQADPYLTPYEHYPAWTRYLSFPEEEIIEQTPFRKRIQRQIPAYRDKAGILTDVLDEMKGTEFFNNPNVSHLDNFIGENLDLNRKTPIDWSTMGYEGPSGAGNQAADTAIVNKNRHDWDRISLEDDPAKFVGHLRGADAQHGFQSALDREKTRDLLGKDLPHPQFLDGFVDDLADYFTGPTFDPFFDGDAAKYPAKVTKQDPYANLANQVNDAYRYQFERKPTETMAEFYERFDRDKPKDFIGGLANDQDTDWMYDAWGDTNDLPSNLTKHLDPVNEVDDLGITSDDIFTMEDIFDTLTTAKNPEQAFKMWLIKKMQMNPAHYKKLPKEAQDNLKQQFDDDMMGGIGG